MIMSRCGGTASCASRALILSASRGCICNYRLSSADLCNLFPAVPLHLHSKSWCSSFRGRGRLRSESASSYHSKAVVDSKASSLPLVLTATSSSSSSPFSGDLALGLKEIKGRCNKWQWKGHGINYFVLTGSTPNPSPLLLVHGFGASISHWRRCDFFRFSFSTI